MSVAEQSLAACLIVALACGEEGGGDEGTTPPTRATVVFVYEGATEIDPTVAERFGACVMGVERTHIHPSWRAFARFDMAVVDGRWTITFEDVPVTSRQRVRISDPNLCAENPTGAATLGLVANGVRLTDIVDTPGSGTEPGFALSVSDDGTVTP